MAEDNSGSYPGETHTVNDPRIAALLTDPTARQFYSPFLARTTTVKEAADEVGCTIDTMLYRVRVFLKAGLLKITEERQRKGRPVKHYRTVHDAYFVPHAVTPFATLEERLYTNHEPYLRDWARSTAKLLQQQGQEGKLLFRDELGRVHSKGAGETSRGQNPQDALRPPGWDITVTLHLSEDQAREVQAALARLVEGFLAEGLPSDPPSERERAFALSVFFYPETD